LISAEQAETDTQVAKNQITPNSSPPPLATVIDQALPGRRIPSKLSTNLILATAVSLVLGLGLAFLRDYLDYSVHSPEQLEDVLGLATIAAIGSVGGTGIYQLSNARWWKRRGRRRKNEVAADHSESKLITLEDPNSPESESFRVLRTNIQFSSLEKPIHSLVVTSAGSREGKSFISANLAVVMAQAGKRVILVDADLRRPRLHELFGLPNRIGFTNLVVAGSNEVAGAAQMVPGVNNLAVITSGPLPPNPSELLDSRQAARVIDQLTQQTDVVIFDSPPAGAVTDPMILAARLDGVILVISAGSTRRDVIARTKQSLQNVGAAVLLPVLNRVVNRDMENYYSYRPYSNEQRDGLPDGQGPHRNSKAPAHVSSIEPALSGSQATRQNRR
jgi:capsular exopolysaccharide synthesis family protein